MAGISCHATAWACRSRLLVPLNHLRTNAAKAGRMLGDPPSLPCGKPLESVGTDVPMDVSGLKSREAEVRDMPVKDGLIVNMVKEDGRGMGGEFSVLGNLCQSLGKKPGMSESVASRRPSRDCPLGYFAGPRSRARQWGCYLGGLQYVA
jgi:hypothetical protein